MILEHTYRLKKCLNKNNGTKALYSRSFLPLLYTFLLLWHSHPYTYFVPMYQLKKGRNKHKLHSTIVHLDSMCTKTLVSARKPELWHSYFFVVERTKPHQIEKGHFKYKHYKAPYTGPILPLIQTSLSVRNIGTPTTMDWVALSPFAGTREPILLIWVFIVCRTHKHLGCCCFQELGPKTYSFPGNCTEKREQI